MSCRVAGGILSCVNAASQMVETLEGMFGADYSEYNQLKAEYDGLIEVWDQLLERKRAYIDESYGAEAAQVGEEALNLLGKQEQAARELARERLGAGASAGSHSIGYRMWEGDGSRWIDVAGQIRQALGVHFYGISDMTDMTAEQLLYIQENYPRQWAMMDHEFRSYMESIIEYGDEAAGIAESISERLTAVSFDSLYDSFVDTLMDMDASAEDIAGNVGEYFMRALLENQIGEQYKERLKEWYDRFSGAMEDGSLSSWEQSLLTQEYQDIVEEAAALRDQLAEATGYTGGEGGTTQTGKAGSFSAMSQEQGTKLEGLFTSGQMHWASIDGQMQDVSEQMGTAVDHLRRIEENTGSSAKHLGEIKEDIKRIIRDGLKIK